MSDNPDGTPNPLNPMPVGGSNGDEESTTGIGEFDFVETAVEKEPVLEPTSEPVEGLTVESIKEEIISEPEPILEAGPTIEPEPIKIPVSNSMPEIKKAEPVIHEPTTVIDPMMRPVSHNHETPKDITHTPDVEPEPVAKDSIVEPIEGKNHSKKAFIIGGIIFFVAAIICGAAAIAIMILNNNSGDKVTRAIDRLLNGEISSIIAVNGVISSSSGADYINFSDSNSTSSTSVSLEPTVKSVNIDVDGAFDFATAVNKVSAIVDVEAMDGSEYSLDIDELRTKGGNTFFRISGVKDILPATTAGDGLTDLNGTLGMLMAFSNILNTIDDEWILVSDNFGQSMNGLKIFDNDATCLTNALGTLPNYTKDLVNKYKANQFITYSTDKLGINKRKNTLYRLGFDSEKMSAFINSLSNNGFINELNACSGQVATNSTTSADLLEGIFKDFPTVYAEIDDNYNFTRLYFEVNSEINGQESTTVADLNLSYPSKIEIDEPGSYIEMSSIVNTILTGVLNNNGLNTTTE